MNSRRQGQGLGLVLSGPRAGTVRRIPLSSFRSADYIPGTRVPMFHPHLPAAAAHRRRRQRARVAAASEEAILHGLQEVTGSAGEECAVCLQEFQACPGEKIRAMPGCSHAFHQHCISEWLRRNAVCPLCRHPLLPD